LGGSLFKYFLTDPTDFELIEREKKGRKADSELPGFLREELQLSLKVKVIYVFRLFSPNLLFAFAFSQRTTPSCIGTKVWLHSSLPRNRLPQTKKKKMFFFGVSDILWIIYFFFKIVILTQTLHQPTQHTQKPPPNTISP